MEIKELLQQAEDRMNKSIEALKHEFASIRTGRASVALLDKVMVDIMVALLQLTKLRISLYLSLA